MFSYSSLLKLKLAQLTSSHVALSRRRLRTPPRW